MKSPPTIVGSLHCENVPKVYNSLSSFCAKALRKWWEGKRLGDFILGEKPRPKTRKSHMTKEELRSLKVAKTHLFMSSFIRKINQAHAKEISALHRAISNVERARVERIKLLANLPASNETDAGDGISAFHSLAPVYLSTPSDEKPEKGLVKRNESGIKTGTRTPVLRKYTWVQRSVIVFTHLHHLLGNANFGHTETLTGVKRSTIAASCSIFCTLTDLSLQSYSQYMVEHDFHGRMLATNCIRVALGYGDERHEKGSEGYLSVLQGKRSREIIAFLLGSVQEGYELKQGKFKDTDNTIL
jgi:hypothetical protein